MTAFRKPPKFVSADESPQSGHERMALPQPIAQFHADGYREDVTVDPDIFTDVIGRHFRQPAAGLGFDNSPVAHMWRSMIWPNNFL